MSATPEGTIVYEVNIDLDAGIEADYRAWLRAHIAEILSLPGFVDAHLFDVIDPATTTDRIRLCTQYRLRDADALRDYLDQHAPRLRADGIARFGQRFSATRRVLRPTD